MTRFFHILLLAFSLAGSRAALGSDLWKDRIQFYLAAYEGSVDAPKPIVYPQLAERVRLQFPTGAVIHVSWTFRQGDGRVVEGELYSRSGELFVVQKQEGWNLVTKGAYVYEWKVGATSGIMIEKNESDLVDYALYLTDPALLMTGLYHEYLSTPGSFVRKDSTTDGITTLRLRKPLEGFHTVSLTERPLWFRGYSFTNPVTNIDGTFSISAPMIVPDVPVEVVARMENVEFQSSNISLKRHLKYL